MSYLYNKGTSEICFINTPDQVIQQPNNPDQLILTIQNIKKEIQRINLEELKKKLDLVQQRLIHFQNIDFDPICSWVKKYLECENYYLRITQIQMQSTNNSELSIDDIKFCLSWVYQNTQFLRIKDLDTLLETVQIHYTEEMLLIGQFKPWMSGVGMIEFPKGHKIIGEIRFAHLFGKGVFITTNGNQFLGATFINNKLNGFGVVLKETGEKIEGYFIDSILQSGHIKLSLPNGNILEAEFDRNLKNNQQTNLTQLKYSSRTHNIIYECTKFTKNLRENLEYSIKRNNQLLSRRGPNGQVEGFISNLQSGQLMLTGYFNVNQLIRGEVQNNQEQVLDSGTFSNNQLNGDGTRYFLSRLIKERGWFVNGKLDGPGTIYYEEEGKIRQQGKFKEGQLTGEGGKTFFQTQQIESEGSFQNGQLHGIGTIYYQNGKIAERGEFVSGLLQGEGEKRHENGACQEYGIFFEGKLHSDQFQSAKASPNEIILEEGYFQQGVLSGQGIKYDNNGNKVEEGKFINGKLNGRAIKFWENGNVKEEGTFINGILNGANGKEYYEDGSLKSEGSYNNGNLHEQSTIYFKCYEVRAYFQNGKISGTSTLINHSLKQNFTKVSPSTEDFLQSAHDARVYLLTEWNFNATYFRRQ